MSVLFQKTWMKNNVSYVIVDKNNRLYHDMCSLMKCLTEVWFNSQYVEFKITLATDKLVLNNVQPDGRGLQMARYVATIQVSIRICDYYRSSGKIMTFL